MCEQCKQLESDALTMALRLMGEEEDTMGPDCMKVMDGWRPKCRAALCAAAGIDPDLPEFLGGPGVVTAAESPLAQIGKKLGAIAILIGEIDALATQLRHGTDDPDLYDRELETAAFELGIELSKLFGPALEINTKMRLLVENAQDELSEIHVCRNIAARRGM